MWRRYVRRENCELTLVTPDNTKIQCHALVAAANSPYIRDAISKQIAKFTKPTEDQHGLTYEVKLNVGTGNILKLFVEYFYLGRLTMENNMLFDIMMTARLFQINELMEEATDALISSINTRSVKSYLSLARIHNVPRITKECHSFISENFANLLSSTNVLKTLEYEDFLSVISKIKLKADDAMNAVVMWLEVHSHRDNTKEEIDAYCLTLFRCIAFDKCSNSVLHTLLNVNFKCSTKVETLIIRKCVQNLLRSKTPGLMSPPTSPEDMPLSPETRNNSNSVHSTMDVSILLYINIYIYIYIQQYVYIYIYIYIHTCIHTISL